MLKKFDLRSAANVGSTHTSGVKMVKLYNHFYYLLTYRLCNNPREYINGTTAEMWVDWNPHFDGYRTSNPC